MPRNGAQWETLMQEQGSLTVSQLKEAAICFYKEGSLSLSATLFSHYLKRVPYGDQPDMYRMAGTALHRADFYMPSAHAWDQYFLLTPSPSAADYLHAGRAYFSANKNEPSQTCFRAYASHPDLEETSNQHLFESAEAHIHLGDFKKSVHYWRLYFACIKSKPTSFDYSNAAFAFAQIGNFQESSNLWKKGLLFKEMPIQEGAFMGALNSFNEIEDCENILWLLKQIPKRMVNPSSKIYSQAASIYRDLQKDEQAAHMWDQFFLHPDAQPEPDDYANAARTYFLTSQVIRAHEMWKKHFSYTNIIFEDQSYKSFAIVLSAMGKYEESTAIWAKYFSENRSKDVQLQIIYARDLCALGKYVEAVHQYDSCFDHLMASKDNANLILATLAYCMAGDLEKTIKLHNKRIALGFLPSKILICLPKPSTSASKSKKKQKKAKNPKFHIGPEMIQTIKMSIGQTAFSRATGYYDQSKNVTFSQLQDLRENLMAQYKTCLGHFLALKNGPAPSPSLTCQASSSSTSLESPDVDTPSGHFHSLQQVVREMENTYAIFSREHEKLKALDHKKRYQKALQNLEYMTGSPFEGRGIPRHNLRGDYGRAPKGKKNTSAPLLRRVIPSQAQASTSASSSSSCPLPEVQWHITPGAMGQYEGLNPSQLYKFEQFKSEITHNPWLDQSITGTLSGKPKKLKGYSNLYSRRFDHKNRLVYRVTQDLETKVTCVTILGFLTHYKALERS